MMTKIQAVQDILGLYDAGDLVRWLSDVAETDILINMGVSCLDLLESDHDCLIRIGWLAHTYVGGSRDEWRLLIGRKNLRAMQWADAATLELSVLPIQQVNPKAKDGGRKLGGVKSIAYSAPPNPPCKVWGCADPDTYAQVRRDVRALVAEIAPRATVVTDYLQKSGKTLVQVNFGGVMGLELVVPTKKLTAIHAASLTSSVKLCLEKLGRRSMGEIT